VTSLPDYLEFSPMKPAELNKIFPMMSEHGLDLLNKCLKLDPNQRPTA